MSDETKPPEGATDQTQQTGEQGAASTPPAPPPAAAGKKRTPAAAPTGGVRVRCTLENCGEKINGVSFSQVRDPKGKTPPFMLSDEITQDQADAFLAIPGYTIDE